MDNDRWQVESESTPGKFYDVRADSIPARNFGVKYSCDCASWINNTNGTRVCKHTSAVLKEELMAKTTENFRSNTVVNPSASMNRARGRPNSWEVKTCKYCKKASILLKQKGYCKYCYKKEDGTMTKWSERVSDSRTYAS